MELMGKQASGLVSSDRIAVLVLGMHRSGTSALTRVVSLLGCDLPKDLMAANPTNEAGHWESSAIARLNDEILSSAGSTWHDWLAFNPGWYASPKAAEFKERALAALAEEFGTSRLFVLKDPRICRFAPFWLDVIETAGVRPAVIMPVRNPLEVAESLETRNGFDPALGHLLWLRHVLEAEAGTRGLRRFHCSYEGLLGGWPRLISGTQEQLGISWPRLSNLVSEEVEAFLTDRLRHHRQSSKSVSDNPLLSAWLREAFAIFSRWADEGESTADHVALDGIRAELDGAAPAFARLISAGRQSAQQAKALDASLKEAEARLGAAEAAVAAHQQQVQQFEHQLEEARAALSSSQATAAEKERQIAEAAERLTAARAELADVQAEVQSLRAELEDSRAQLSQTQSALAQRSAEADDMAAQLRAAESRMADELQAERARLAERFDEIAALSRMLQEKEAEVAATQHRSRADEEAAERRMADAERAGRLAEELDAERARLNEQFGKVADLTSKLRQKEAEVSAANERAQADAEAIRRRLTDTETRLSERFSEIATMTRLLGEKERAAHQSEEHVAWLRDVSAVLMNGMGSGLKGRLAAFMPAPIRLAKQKARLKRKGIFDPDAYLAANPDVAEAGLDPLWHYVNHGIGEGRPLK